MLSYEPGIKNTTADSEKKVNREINCLAEAKTKCAKDLHGKWTETKPLGKHQTLKWIGYNSRRPHLGFTSVSQEQDS